MNRSVVNQGDLEDLALGTLDEMKDGSETENCAPETVETENTSRTLDAVSDPTQPLDTTLLESDPQSDGLDESTRTCGSGSDVTSQETTQSMDQPDRKEITEDSNPTTRGDNESSNRQPTTSKWEGRLRRRPKGGGRRGRLNPQQGEM